MKIPKRDGQVVTFDGTNSGRVVPRVYFVNGIRVTGREHARSAALLSLVTEHKLFGVYNATAGQKAGSVLDLLQCAADWSDIFLSKLAETSGRALNSALSDINNFMRGLAGHPPAKPVNVAESIRKKIPANKRAAFVEKCVSTYNPATASLFRELRGGLSGHQKIIAHSQGNLITSDALWSLVIAYGQGSLAQIQVFSLASPAPAWPLGLRKSHGGGGRKVYGHTNDFVTLLDPHNHLSGKFGRAAGDWRSHGDGKIGIGGHDINKNIGLNFYNTVRRELGRPQITTDDLLQRMEQSVVLVP